MNLLLLLSKICYHLCRSVYVGHATLPIEHMLVTSRFQHSTSIVVDFTRNGVWKHVRGIQWCWCNQKIQQKTKTICVSYFQAIFSPILGTHQPHCLIGGWKKGEENISVHDACQFPQTKFGKKRSHVLKNIISMPWLDHCS